MSMGTMVSRIGSYEILETLGSGGIGIVYRARHEQTGRIVALKTVRIPREGLLANIRREIQTLLRYRHPGIVRVLDEGVEQGLPWYAMELVEGAPLLDHCASLRRQSRQRKSWQGWLGKGQASEGLRQILTVLRRLCASLAYLHGEGLVHRDLKPDNVMVRKNGFPILMDFGLIAHFAGEESREELDVGGVVMGTVGYMAPEQLRGEYVDARADLYALGCILYEILTGQPPFVGETERDVLQAHLEAEAVPPSRLADDVPPKLEDLVLRLLAKSPRSRVGHANSVAAVLVELGGADRLPKDYPRPRDYLYRPALAGRDGEIEEVEKSTSILDGGMGALVLVGGESGVGKTRFAMEIALRARRKGHSVLTGEGLPLSGSAGGNREVQGGPLHPLRGVLQLLADRCRERGPEETKRLLGVRGRVLALYEPALAALPELENYPPPAQIRPEAMRLRLFGYLCEVLEILARDHATLLILDDLQWADELTLGFLEYWQRVGGGRAPLVIFGTYRNEAIQGPLDKLVGMSGVRKLTLERLAPEAIHSMVCDMLALEEAPEALVSFLSRQSEGNPFFVAEYLRMTISEGLLFRDEMGRWKVMDDTSERASEKDYEALPLPGSLRELVSRRLEGLDEAARAVVEVAAVVGLEMEVAILEEVLARERPSLLAGLKELFARHILESASKTAQLSGGSSDTRPGLLELRFVHDKFRKVAYEQISPRRRLKLHRAVAQAIEKVNADSVHSHPAELGYHWQRCGGLEKARDYYASAAREAVERSAQVEAERLYRACLDLFDEDEPELQSIGVLNDFAAKVLSVTGRNQEAEGLHRLALDEARLLREPFAEARSLQGLATTQRVTGRMSDARASCERALAIYRRIGSRRWEGIALAQLAFIHRDQGLVEQAQSFFEDALTIHHEVQDSGSSGRTLGNLAQIYWQQGFLNEARGFCHKARSIHREVGNRRGEGNCLNVLGGLLLEQGDVPKARDCLEEALAIHRELGDRFAEPASLVGLAALERKGFGNIDKAASLIEKAESMVRQLGDVFGLAQCLCERGHQELFHGRSGNAFLKEAKDAISSSRILKSEGFGRDVEHLAKAVQWTETKGSLFRGERIDDYSEGLWTWLAKNGHLTVKAARVRPPKLNT